MSYEVMCVCGQLLRGARQRRHQVVSCPNCSRKIFVLPASPLDIRDEPATPAPPPSRLFRSWQIPLLVGTGSVVVLLGLFLLARPYLLRQKPVPEEPVPPDNSSALRDKMESSRRAMAQGRFHAARRDLDEVISERRRHPKLLTPPEILQLKQLHRQADLLAGMSPSSLEEIVERAMLVRDSEERSAQLDFFRGKSFVFDATVRRDRSDPTGRWLKLGSYSVEVDGKRVRLALEDLEILRDLPLDESARIIFGARFAGTEPEKGGDERNTGWVIHFIPDSGVLFTDRDAVEAASPVLLTPGLKETLERQREWLIERRMLAPARP